MVYCDSLLSINKNVFLKIVKVSKIVTCMQMYGILSDWQNI